MFLYEAEGKQLLAQFGIATPRARLARTAEDAVRAQRELDGPVVLKAQLRAGGRGKAGLIRRVSGPDVLEAARSLLEATHKGEPVRAILVEEQLQPSAELYIAAYLDTSARRRKLLLCARGGVDVEAAPSRILDVEIGPRGVRDREAIRAAWTGDEVPEEYQDELVRVAECVVDCFLETRARQVEINPLGIAGGRVVAMDAKVILEDDAKPAIEWLGGTGDPLEEEAGAAGLPMVRLDGEIGVITSGAGLGLATVDTIAACGARASNFLDLGGGATPERMRTAIRIVSRIPRLEGLFVNVHGGLNDCVLLAEGVVSSGAVGHVPLLVRMSGYRAQEAQGMLQTHGVRTAGAQSMTSCLSAWLKDVKVERSARAPA